MSGKTVLFQHAEYLLVRSRTDMVSVFEIVHIRTVRGTQTHHQVFALPPEV